MEKRVQTLSNSLQELLIIIKSTIVGKSPGILD